MPGSPDNPAPHTRAKPGPSGLASSSALRPALILALAGPMLMVLANITINFWMGLASIYAGHPPRQQSLIPLAFAVAYTASSYLAGRFATRRHATAALVIAVVVTAAMGTAAFVVTWFPFMLMIAAINGLVAAQYFVVFQFRMGHVRPFHALAWNIVAYNMSWGTGDALAPLLVGAFRTMQPWWIVMVTWLIAAIHLALLAWSSAARDKPDERIGSDQPLVMTPSTRAQRRLSFIGTVAVILCYSGLYYTLYPGLCKLREWDAMQISLGLCCMVSPVLTVTPLWAWWWPRIDRPWGLGVSLLIGAAGAGTLFLAPNWWVSLPCLFAVGWAMASAMFHGIYWCNADPDRPLRSVGINEALIGAAGVLGPLLAGQVAGDEYGAPRAYLALASVPLVAGLFTLALARWVSTPKRV